MLHQTLQTKQAVLRCRSLAPDGPGRPPDQAITPIAHGATPIDAVANGIRRLQRWTTPPPTRSEEHADNPAPAPTLSPDLWFPPTAVVADVSFLRRIAPAIHCTVHSCASSTASGAPESMGNPTGHLAPGGGVSSSALSRIPPVTFSPSISRPASRLLHRPIQEDLHH